MIDVHQNVVFEMVKNRSRASVTDNRCNIHPPTQPLFGNLLVGVTVLIRRIRRFSLQLVTFKVLLLGQENPLFSLFYFGNIPKKLNFFDIKDIRDTGRSIEQEPCASVSKRV